MKQPCYVIRRALGVAKNPVQRPYIAGKAKRCDCTTNRKCPLCEQFANRLALAAVKDVQGAGQGVIVPQAGPDADFAAGQPILYPLNRSC